MGNFTMCLVGVSGITAGTSKLYPSDGRGSVVLDTPGSSFVRSAQTSIITFAYGMEEAANTYLEFYHGDDTLAYHVKQDQSSQIEWNPDFGPDGIVLVGNWYCIVGDTSPVWNIGFKVM